MMLGRTRCQIGFDKTRPKPMFSEAKLTLLSVTASSQADAFNHLGLKPGLQSRPDHHIQVLVSIYSCPISECRHQCRSPCILSERFGSPNCMFPTFRMLDL